MRVWCPSDPRFAGDPTGCGAEFEADPAGVATCPECGLHFLPRPPRVRTGEGPRGPRPSRVWPLALVLLLAAPWWIGALVWIASHAFLLLGLAAGVFLVWHRDILPSPDDGDPEP